MNADFKINGKELVTDRLILRPFRESDLRGFYEYASVPGVGEMAGWRHHADIDESREILTSFIRDDRTFAIYHRQDGKVIGSLGVERYGAEDKLTEFEVYLGRELGYVLSRDYWGRGLMAEAVSAVIDYLFSELSLDFLLCGHYNFNVQSARVQQKCGFKPYRRLVMDTRMGTKEEGKLTLLLNTNKKVILNFSHPETLIWERDN